MRGRIRRILPLKNVIRLQSGTSVYVFLDPLPRNGALVLEPIRDALISPEKGKLTATFPKIEISLTFQAVQTELDVVLWKDVDRCRTSF